MIGAGAVGAVLIAAAFLLRTTTTPLDADTIAASFDGTAGTAPGEPGIYTYATEGYESIDALSGARHDYPATTYAVIEDGPCGPVVRWSAIEERWFEWSHCGPDLAITSTRSYHRWFGVPDEEIEECPVPLPIATSAGGVSCHANGTVETYDVERMGRESLVIGGVEVEAVHLRRTSSLSGESTGSTVADVWRLPGTPLIIRLELSTMTSTSSAAGDVAYEERVDLLLESLLPAS